MVMKIHYCEKILYFVEMGSPHQVIALLNQAVFDHFDTFPFGLVGEAEAEIRTEAEAEIRTKFSNIYSLQLTRDLTGPKDVLLYLCNTFFVNKIETRS